MATNHDDTPSRRQLLKIAAGTAAAAPVGAAAGAMAGAAGADAELLALCAAWQANNAEYECLVEVDRASEREALDRGKRLCEQEHVDFSENVAEGHELLERISGTRAKTAAGRLAKARVLIARLAPGGADDTPSSCNHDECLAYSMALDEVALAGGAA